MLNKFQNRWIVITRPVHQAGSLIQKLEANGANIIAFPLLEIIEPDCSLQLKQQLNTLERFDTAIFISPNAVARALTFIDKTQLSSINIAAVGKKTALSLRNHGLSVDYFPQSLFNSEALLALEPLQQVQQQRIIIFRGQGGRDLLRNTLVERGATVTYANVYVRRCPMDNIEQLKLHYYLHKLDMIVLTSGESLQHLLRLANNEQWLTQIPLLVGSQRIKKKFQQHFTGTIWVASDPSDETIYKYLDSYL